MKILLLLLTLSLLSTPTYATYADLAAEEADITGCFFKASIDTLRQSLPKPRRGKKEPRYITVPSIFLGKFVTNTEGLIECAKSTEITDALVRLCEGQPDHFVGRGDIELGRSEIDTTVREEYVFNFECRYHRRQL